MHQLSLTATLPYVAVLTGGVASGKSTVGAIFQALGAKVIDTDALSHALTSAKGQALPAIRRVFGEQFINAEGLDRAAMRAYVFGNRAARLQLESILHPLIRAEQWRLIFTPPRFAINVVQIPLFVETGGQRFGIATPEGAPIIVPIQRVIAIDCPLVLQRARLIDHRGLSADMAERLLSAQCSASERQRYADEVIVNDRNLAKLETLSRWAFSRLAAHEAQWRAHLPEGHTGKMG